MLSIPDPKNLVTIIKLALWNLSPRSTACLRAVLSARIALKLLTSHLVVALIALVVVGGATRVMEAGLACPDWPLCYGALLPGRQMNLQVFLEWFHRLDAFFVGVGLLSFTGLTIWRRRELPHGLPWIATLAVALVVFQGVLGALTVTHLLAASTVTAHLATALVLVFLLSAIDRSLVSPQAPLELPNWWFPLLLSTTALVFAQCVLGGAMASHWAVDHCFSQGERCEWLLRHRQLAIPATVSLLLLASASLLCRRLDAPIRALCLSAASFVALQVGLGVLTLRWELQQPFLTIAHQLVAALLIAHLGALVGRTLRVSVQGPATTVMEVSCG